MSVTTPEAGRTRVALDRVIPLSLAIVAALWHAMLMTRATNDNFLHLSLAQQWLAGDWPVRDFFDQGWVLQYSLSAAAHLLLGERLGAEAVIVALAWSLSTFLGYQVVKRLTGSPTIAVACALLLIVSSARGYSYPKGIVYAAAAWLWWRYVTGPTLPRIVAFATWTAVAFYWRPDHGVYVAVGLTLAAFAAHGVSRTTITRCLTAGAVTVGWIVPFLIYVQLVYGLVPYVQTGLAAAEVEHGSHGTHEWPVLRYAGNLIAFEPAETYAPTIGIRWRRDSPAESRQDVRSRYHLNTIATEDDGLDRVRLSADSIARLRALVNEPLIDDTAGIDRSAGTLLASNWPADRQWKFKSRWLRMQLLPMLDAQARATELTAALFFAFPMVLLIAAPWMSRRLFGTTPRQLVAFALFTLLVAWAMIRNPFAARVADAVVLSSIAFGCCLGSVWQARSSGGPARLMVRLITLLVAVSVVLLVARAGQFESPLKWAGTGENAYRELTASPPLAFYVDRPARFTLRLAAYVRDCVPEQDRLLVFWFEPEIYYYSERLMALRHGVFAPTWAALEQEQRATLEKVERFKPPLVLARQSALDEYARATYPGVIGYVRREYQLAATVREAGEDYLIYARRDRPVLRGFDTQQWPCYTRQPSQWARVGVAP